MSAIEIFGVKKNGDVVSIGTVNNSWLGSMHVLHTLSNKYKLPANMDEIGFNRLWGRMGSGWLLPYEELVLETTLPRTVISSKRIIETIQSLNEYAHEYPESNLGIQAKILEDELFNGYIGFCWNNSSSSSSIWDAFFNMDIDAYEQVNIFGDRSSMITVI